MSQPRRQPEVPLGDDLFLIALDDRTGELIANPHAAGLGLAGALVAELLLTRNVTVRSGQIEVVAATAHVPGEPLARRTLGRLMVEPETVDLASWLAYFAQEAVDVVSERLAQSGWIRREAHQRRRGGKVVTHRPVDPNPVAWRSVRLAHVMNNPSREPWTWRDVVLGALVNATGLIKHVLWQELHPGVDHLHAVLDGANQQWPDVCELARHVEAAVGGATLSHR